LSAYDFSRITPKFTILKIPTKPKLIILITKYENVDPKTKTKSFAKSITNKTKKKRPDMKNNTKTNPDKPYTTKQC
jgi:selenocysteine-specific translation elongation factor